MTATDAPMAATHDAAFRQQADRRLPGARRSATPAITISFHFHQEDGACLERGRHAFIRDGGILGVSRRRQAVMRRHDGLRGSP